MAAAPPPPAPRGAPLMAPARPAAFVARPAELQRLRHHLRAGPPGRPLALTTAWPGASGGGKTTLAAALGHDPEVRRAFPAGILWVTLGPAPNLLAVLTDLVAALIGERPFFGDADAAAAQLDRLVAARRCLLVLDDVWAIGHLTAFPLLRDPRALVITTHFPDLAAAARAEAVVVDAMTGPQASALLAQAHAPSADLAPLAVLAARLGAWPILLDLARGALQALLARSAPWPAALAQVDAALDAAGVPPVAPPTGADPHPALHGLLDLSLHLLDGAARD
ncbi:MAG TPA: NB-ARC domain-containing protein, partial [Chloroflexia bacterium]|nr:NB-ARC domain-containing protein [Chloroflexia bacterium]